MNFYNENNPKAAAWLRQLISDGHIPAGVVDERSIVDVRAEDLRGFKQLHFFAGIGGWSRALYLAGFPSDRPIVSASLPCQPFSAAGKQLAQADERHLWPVFFNLVRSCRDLEPFEFIFGEQVPAAIRLGWLDGVFADLAREGYACGNTVLGAHSVGAPHIRQRIYWGAFRMADAGRIGGAGWRGIGDVACAPREVEGVEEKRERLRNTSDDGSANGSMADTDGARRISSAHAGIHCGEESAGAPGESVEATGERASSESRGPGSVVGMGDTDGSAAERLGPVGLPVEPKQEAGRPDDANPWAGCELIRCADGKARRVKPGIFPLADGIPGRVDVLRGAGNAIVPQVAAEFVKAFIETKEAIESECALLK